MTNSRSKNDLTNIPAAACRVCGGWTSQGGMSQHAEAVEPVMGRTGCTGPHVNGPSQQSVDEAAERAG